MALENEGGVRKMRPRILSHEARPIYAVTSAHFVRAVPNRCTSSVRIAAANSCAVRIGKTDNYRCLFWLPPWLIPRGGLHPLRAPAGLGQQRTPAVDR